MQYVQNNAAYIRSLKFFNPRSTSIPPSEIKRGRRFAWRHALVFVFSCIAAVAGANPTHNNHHAYDVITRDIVVIGGGAAGTYAAIRLGDMKQNVMVIERHDRLGGNTETFADPVT